MIPYKHPRKQTPTVNNSGKLESSEATREAHRRRELPILEAGAKGNDRTT